MARPCTQRCGRRPPCEVSRERRKAQGRVCPWPRREPATRLHARSASQPQKRSGGHRDVQAAERAPRPGGEARTPPTCAGHFTTASARTQVSQGPDARMNRQRPIHDAPRSAQTPSRRVKRTQAACFSGVRVTRAMKQGCYTIESRGLQRPPETRVTGRNLSGGASRRRRETSTRLTSLRQTSLEAVSGKLGPGREAGKPTPEGLATLHVSHRRNRTAGGTTPSRRAREKGGVQRRRGRPAQRAGCRGGAPAAHRP